MKSPVLYDQREFEDWMYKVDAFSSIPPRTYPCIAVVLNGYFEYVYGNEFPAPYVPYYWERR